MKTNICPVIDRECATISNLQKRIKELEVEISQIKVNFSKATNACSEKTTLIVGYQSIPLYVYHPRHGYGVITKQVLGYSNIVMVKFFDPMGSYLKEMNSEDLATAYVTPWTKDTIPYFRFKCCIGRDEYSCELVERNSPWYPTVYGVAIWDYTNFASFEYLAKKAIMPNGAPCGTLRF